MHVMKFGGASVNSPDRIRNVAQIMIAHTNEPIAVVVSAMGKMTNALEKLGKLVVAKQEEEARDQLRLIIRKHVETAEGLFGEQAGDVVEQLSGYFVEIDQIMEGGLLLGYLPVPIQDKLVAYGELLSTTLVAAYVKTLHEDCHWLDARKLIKTDASYGRAKVIWSKTSETVKQAVGERARTGRILITQGYIASTPYGDTTTLGREGSDYTAAILAHCLDANRVTVWKEVRGILSADPRIKPDAEKFDYLSYDQAVEMTFYGASVIHPKTIKPLFSKGIPLYVKCFKDVNLPGTCISSRPDDKNLPAYIVKKNQCCLRLASKDFSFMDERMINEVFAYVYKSGLKVNLVQNSAISLFLCVDYDESLTKYFAELTADQFDVEVRHPLCLYTYINQKQEDKPDVEGALMMQRNGKKLFIVRE